ncbi:TPA: UDP-N-acetylmuramate dehydrogenase [Candidatus Gracilibacteria bacterium]|nr:UDP-N-acetylmuramate dehydrogenase [Candidatus Peregrinibacteria bacterium]HIQ56637.1 UDP-N-acetylmuramate dehydrogenase [Candidatus Gracilibacteria bacterium]HIQ57268.1 UDP-N-acetylmuramate dehydrogenase [Candidatus Gracilibacteria bacterium]
MKFEYNKPLAKYTTFRVGGNSDIFVTIEKKEDFYNPIFSEILKNSENIFILGGGSNTVFSDNGFRGTVIYMNNRNIEKVSENSEKCIIKCESGAQIMPIFMFAKKNSADFSPFSTIPGTIGGALAGNAGVPKMEISDIFIEAELFDIEKQEFITVDTTFFNFVYRHSDLQSDNKKNKYIIWSVTLQLQKRDIAEIESETKEYLEMRKQKQPFGKTGGSFFKNPQQGAAGMFLDKAEFKNYKHGGAFFSEKHANFLMSDGTATQKDIIELQKIAQTKIFEQFGVTLEREVRVLDEFGKLTQ